MKKARLKYTTTLSYSRVVIILFVALTAKIVFAEPDNNELIINGVIIKTDSVANEVSLHKWLYSGWRF